MDGAEDIRGGEEASLALVRKAPCKLCIARKYGMILTPFRLFLAFPPYITYGTFPRFPAVVLWSQASMRVESRVPIPTGRYTRLLSTVLK
jgi:hypothetical protein